MAINPENIDTVTVTQLDTVALALTNFFAHSAPNGKLGKSAISDLATFIAPYVAGIGASGFIPVIGTVLPDVEQENAYTFVPGPATYTQSLGGDVVTTETFNILVYNGFGWALVVGFAIDLTGYVKITDLYPDYLDNKNSSFSVQERQVLSAIKTLDFQPVDDEKDDDWIILSLTRQVSGPGLNPYSLIIRNLTAGVNWNLVVNESNITDLTGIKYYSGEIYYPYANAVLKYNVGIDFKILPTVFEFNNNSTLLHINPGYLNESSYVLDKIAYDKIPNYVLEKSKVNPYYTQPALKVINAISVFDIVVPNPNKNDDWRISLVATNNPVSPLDSNYRFSIQVRNITSGEAYNIVQYLQPMPVLNQLQGGNRYQGRVFNADGSKYVDYNIFIDWNILGSDFQYYPGVSEIKIVVGTNEAVSGISSGYYQSSLRYPISKLNKSTVAMFGNSIWALSYDMPAAIEKNGAFYKNNAISSSCARAGNPNPGEPLPWPIILRSMGHTIADKVYILANWDAIYRPLATLDPPMRSYFDGQHEVEAIRLGITDAQFYILCSYENVLVPYLNGAKPMPDLFLFNHAYNDYKPWKTYETVEEFTTQPSIRNDKTTYLGAMNFYMDLIIKANPYARVAIVGHYENQYNEPVSLGQKAFSEEWEIPILKTWELTGWSQNRVPGTQHLNVDDAGRVPFAGVDGTDPDKDLTLLQYWVPDNIHPATSAQAQNLLLDIQADWLSRLY